MCFFAWMTQWKMGESEAVNEKKDEMRGECCCMLLVAQVAVLSLTCIVETWNHEGGYSARKVNELGKYGNLPERCDPERISSYFPFLGVEKEFKFHADFFFLNFDYIFWISLFAFHLVFLSYPLKDLPSRWPVFVSGYEISGKRMREYFI